MLALPLICVYTVSNGKGKAQADTGRFGEYIMNTADIIKTHNIRITCTNGNASNKISGSRVTVWDGDSIVDRFEVPKRNGAAYCLTYENGEYGKRFRAAIEEVAEK